MLGQVGEDGGAALFVLVGGHQAGWLVVAPQARGFGLGQRLVVHLDDVVLGDIEGGRGDDHAVQLHPALQDQLFSVAARADAGAGDDFCDAFASLSAMAISGVGWHHWAARLTLSHMNDDEAIALALEEAKSAAARGEVPVGAVLLSADGALLAPDGNRILERRTRPRMPRCWCCVPGRPGSAMSG